MNIKEMINRNTDTRVIIKINNDIDINDINEFTVNNIYPKSEEEIYMEYLNNKKDIFVINVDFKIIDKLEEIIKILKPDIMCISKIENTFTKTIEKRIFKIIKKLLKYFKNKTLIINSDDIYLNKIYNNKIDIYRYGKTKYNDIVYRIENNIIIIKYYDKEYELDIDDSDIINSIIIELLFGKTIEDIVKSINNN